ncbi:hypothetical protein ACFV3R_22915 [Streptomyces sp. NPDC059740]|uniref:hypothetical protein n=1 Tax=Streptomyces sp. NPDC059740 TaxID=3346926 RepID=UPI0036570462
MTLHQQYALDLMRAAQRQEAPPPAPGRHDVETLRALRAHRRTDRILRGRLGLLPRLRAALAARRTRPAPAAPVLPRRRPADCR